jgi:hypothetical protein
MTTALTRKLRWRLAPALTFAMLGCMPDVPPEAEPPEVEVSGGELPEYDDHAADLEEEDDDDRLTLELPDDDFEDAERFLEWSAGMGE